MRSQPKRAPWLWPLVLMAGGIVLLLDNFLLIDMDILAYWPVLVVALGLQLLLRGDIAPSWQAHTFGITRGSVESGSIEIQSGELDVRLRALRTSGRLIAGQFTARSRPGLTVRNNHATLRMQRGQTWWLSMADWDVGLANDLPWGLLVSSYLGRLDVDLDGVMVDRAYVSSGLGGVSVICPNHASGIVFARSTFGDVRLFVPERTRALIILQASPFARVRVDEARFEMLEPGVYATLLDDPGAAAEELAEVADLYVTASTVFGTIHLS